jgi:EAL domain-containing protein (putative c-di-GMP-specific phosphodiesterase class I)/ABC-type nitrate/sulfonate/bicarbonate transport system substrate-binding protein/GGDEF domain-containing protein
MTEELMAEEVSIHLKWYHKFQFAGYYAAQQQGYFADEGYNVTLIEGGPDSNHLHNLISHASEYATLGSEALNSLALGSPIIIVASIFQHSPEVLITLKSNNVQSIKDLAGKPLMLASGSISGQVEAMLLKNQLQATDYQTYTYDGDILKLADGSVFAMYGYISNEPYQLSQIDQQVDLLRPQDYGIDFYGDSLATTQYELDNHPQRVAAMRRAVIRGWNYALKHPDKIINYILARPTNNPLPYNISHQQYEAKTTADLIDTSNIPLGTSSPTRWAYMFDTFNETSGGQAVFTPSSIYNEFHQDRSWIPYVLIAAVFVFIIISVMLAWNRALKNRLNAAITSLKKAAFEDTLTGLKNRSSMMLYIEECRIKNRNNLYLVLIDIAGLQKLNKEQGLKKADLLIQQVAESLSDCALRHSHSYSLYSGKFAIIASADRFSELERKINILLEKITQAHDSIALCAGAIKLDFSLDNSTLATRAELTLQYSKDNKSSKLSFFNLLILEKAGKNEALIEEVIEGINKQEFVAYYQPKINYLTGKIQGLEALIRWDHPDKGILLPGKFLPVVENNPVVMMQLEKAIIETILSQANEIIRYYKDSPNFRISINLSSIQFNHSTIVQDLLSTCQRFLVDTQFIEFELTESSMLADLDLAIETSNQLQAAGFHVALDDFGTGYSSLSYIQNLPVNVIKLDYSFVKKIPQDIRSGFVVEHIISLAHKLGLVVVAEGVEEVDQLHYLGNLKVDMIQGFYFYKPMPLDQACQLDLSVKNYK